MLLSEVGPDMSEPSPEPSSGTEHGIANIAELDDILNAPEVVDAPILGVKRKRESDMDTPDADELGNNIANNITNNDDLDSDVCVIFEQLPIAANIFSFSRVNVLHTFYKHPKLNAYVCHFDISVNEFTYKFEQIKRLDWVQYRPYFRIWHGNIRLILNQKHLMVVDGSKENAPQLIFKRPIGRLTADNVRLLINEYLPESKICKLSLYRPSQPLD